MKDKHQLFTLQLLPEIKRVLNVLMKMLYNKYKYRKRKQCFPFTMSLFLSDSFQL